MTNDAPARKNETFHALKSALGASVKPALAQLGFRPFKSKGKFPERYFRDRYGGVDVIEFQFDKYARPAFRIHFRPIEDEEDLEVIRANQEEMWRWGSAYNASPSNKRYAWFKVGLLERILSPQSGIDRVCRITKQRISEIDQFLRGGEPSPYLSENLTWSDPILGPIGRKPPKRRISR